MENSEQQARIINLGSLLVRELGIDGGVDTFSKWMTHYIAEKIIFAEELPPGKKKREAENECFDIVLKLWERRWSLGSGRRPLEDFESILRTIERMNPEKEEPFFYSSVDYELSALEKENTRFKDIMFCANLASDIDKVARIWIENILHSAAVLAKNEKSGALLRNAVSLPKNADIRVINIVLNNHPLVGLDDDQEDDDEKKKRIERLKMRIEELQKFSKLNKVLIKGYKKDLDDLL